jgi:hypothetical protein
MLLGLAVKRSIEPGSPAVMLLWRLSQTGILIRNTGLRYREQEHGGGNATSGHRTNSSMWSRLVPPFVGSPKGRPELESAAGVQTPVVSAYVTDVIGCVYLHLESIRIKKCERFLGLGVEEFQTAFLKFGANLVGVDMRNSEVVMVNHSGLAFALLNPEEGITDTKDVHSRGVLFQGHPEEFLVKLRRTLHVRDTHGQVIQADRSKPFWLRKTKCS